MTKKELIQVRDSTYKPPTRPQKRCEMCRHFFDERIGGTCVVAGNESETVRGVDDLGVCDLWKRRE